MGERSKVESLPPELKAKLDERLIAGGFSNYTSLSDWLKINGFEIGKSSIHRYGTRLEERVHKLKLATDQAKALVAASPDETADMSEAIMRLMQQQMFEALLNFDPEESGSLAGMAKALGPLVRANIANKKFANEIRAKTAAVVEEMVQTEGMTAKQAEHWRRKFLGVVTQ